MDYGLWMEWGKGFIKKTLSVFKFYQCTKSAFPLILSQKEFLKIIIRL